MNKSSNKKQWSTIILYAFLSPLIFVPGFSLAAQESDEVEFGITAMISEQARCTINNSKDILVPFGEVDIARINGSTYKKMKVDVELTCSNLQNSLLTMQIYGAGASFDASLLDVPAKPGLGVRLLNNGTPQAINEDFTLNYGDAVSLEAVLAKDSGASLAVGSFTTSATLRVTYQ